MIKQEIPQRSYSGVKAITNKTNKKYLAKDFKNRCAYCDDSDKTRGGGKSYHVEHFAPKEKFPELEFTYDNLLYSCPYCNEAKNDDWPSNSSNINVVGNRGYIDPCTKEYGDHLDRDEKTGKIFFKTDLGKYMYQHLHLHLMRHEIIYMVEKLSNRRKILEKTIEEEKRENKDVSKKEKVLALVDKEFFEYFFRLQECD